MKPVSRRGREAIEFEKYLISQNASALIDFRSIQRPYDFKLRLNVKRVN
ncbi:MAG: hypothetical protein WAL79_01255 [Nitrososphaeraceae archaeon]